MKDSVRQALIERIQAEDRPMSVRDHNPVFAIPRLRELLKECEAVLASWPPAPPEPVFTREIPDVATAERCVDAVQTYLREHDSPRAARDLGVAVQILRASALTPVRPPTEEQEKS